MNRRNFLQRLAGSTAAVFVPPAPVITNEAFINGCLRQSGKPEAMAAATSFIRARLREPSYMQSILPAKDV